MRIAFAGTPEVALPSLRALLDSQHDVVVVITRPDARSGRGRALAPSAVALAGAEADVETLKPARPSDTEFQARLAEIAPEAVAVVAYGALLPPSALAIPRHGWINLHFSLLPAWRGAAPVQHALLAGDTVSGATTFRIEEGPVDTGPVFGRLTEEIGPRDTAGALLNRLAENGARLLVATMDAIADGSAAPVPQTDDGVSRAPRLTRDDARLDFGGPAYRVDRIARAFAPVPAAWTTFRGARLKVGPVRAKAAGDLDLAWLAADSAPAPGEILAGKDGVVVGAGSGVVVLGDVAPSGKDWMPAAAWARGARPAPGERFGE